MQSTPNNISVLGTGYVGLVTGLCMAELGHKIITMDVNAEKIHDIQNGVSSIYERKIPELLNRHLGKNFFATTSLHDAIMQTDLTFIAVATPFNEGQIDLTDIRKITAEVAAVIKLKSSWHLIVVKSTVIPGTTEEIILPILEAVSGKKAGKDFGLCMNPEFLREGNAVQDFLEPDRIVIGGIDQKSIDVMSYAYAAFKNTKFICTNTKTAELIKYASNSLFATMISFSNEIANLCAKTGSVDVMDVMQGVWSDKRISHRVQDEYILPGLVEYLKPGCGFGGSCFPKDLNALVAFGKQHDQDMPVLKAALAINEAQPLRMLSYLARHYQDLENVAIGILGIAFKPETNDTRSSPAFVVLDILIQAKAKIFIYDPVVKTLAEKYKNKITFSASLKDLISQVDAALIFTAWDEFKKLPDLITANAREVLIIDGRRMLGKNSIKNYEGIGL
jgi:UDPglucose 6-dehydrogenase